MSAAVSREAKSSLSLRRGDLVDIKSPAEILATLDERGDLEGLSFMPEMAAYCGRRFKVDGRADKICDTVQFSGSRRLPNSVLLEDLRCDGGGHDGCQAACRLFWKEDWLVKVAEGEPTPAPFPEQDRRALLERASAHACSSQQRNGKAQVFYRCQGTEIPKYSQHLRTFDPRPYFRELTSGNVQWPRFVRVMGRALVEEPQRKLGLLADVALVGTAQPGETFETLNVRVGEWVRVKSKEEISKTLNAKGMNKGLRFDREMLPFCGQVFRVRQRVERFIDETKGTMMELKSEAILLEGAVCAGDLNPGRWFCPRGIYEFWRECWLERVQPPASRSERREVATAAGTGP